MPTPMDSNPSPVEWLTQLIVDFEMKRVLSFAVAVQYDPEKINAPTGELCGEVLTIFRDNNFQHALPLIPMVERLLEVMKRKAQEVPEGEPS